MGQKRRHTSRQREEPGRSQHGTCMVVWRPTAGSDSVGNDSISGDECCQGQRGRAGAPSSQPPCWAKGGGGHGVWEDKLRPEESTEVRHLTQGPLGSEPGHRSLRNKWKSFQFSLQHTLALWVTATATIMQLAAAVDKTKNPAGHAMDFDLCKWTWRCGLCYQTAPLKSPPVSDHSPTNRHYSASKWAHVSGPFT